MRTKIKNLIMSATALVLCCAILLITNYSLSAQSSAAQSAQTSSRKTETLSASAQGDDADETADGKEEVVYVSMDASGTVTAINVVNIFNGAGDITDYGDYTDVKMLTTNDAIVMKDDVITFTTSSERVYYQGTLSEETPLPWTISLTYYMDGVEYTAEEIAGMSGSLKIEISVSENESYEGEGDFYNSFLLQASLTLDTENAKDIVAEGATVANVGSDKQLSYMIIPGQELTAEITAEVTDFEMPAIEINGVALDLALDIDDEDLEDTIDELMDALEELESGASELSSGATELSSGAETLNSGVVSLSDGAESLDEGISSLYSGMQTLKSGLETLNENSDELTEGSAQVLAALETIESSLSVIDSTTEQLTALTEASAQIQSGIDSLYSGILSLQTNLSYSNYKVVMAANGLDIDELVEGNTQAIAAIQELLPVLSTVSTVLSNDLIAAYVQKLGIDIDVAELETLATTLITLLQGNNAAIAGMEAYLDEVSSGVDTLSEGAAALSESYSEFNEAITTLASSLSSLVSQMVVLQSGVEALVDSYQELDSGLSEYTQGVAEVVAGYNQLVSGVSALSSGSSELSSGVSELAEGSAELYEGTLTLSDGSDELSDGTSQLYSEITTAQDDLEDEYGYLFDLLSGEYDLCSFVSSKNTNVSEVQFVITTEPIEIEVEEETEAEEAEEEDGLWQRIINLFS